MARPKTFITHEYSLTQNPFPPTAIVVWGSSDDRENGSLFCEEVCREKLEEATHKFIVNPVDSGSKFHFLWSLGEGEEARGFGKTAMLHHLARRVNTDLGHRLLTGHEFSEQEAAGTPILAAMGTFNRQDVTTLAAVSLEQVRYLAQPDPGTGQTTLGLIRQRILEELREAGDLPKNPRKAGSADEVDAIVGKIREADLGIGGKTLGTPDQKFVRCFAGGTATDVLAYLRGASAKGGFELLSTLLVISRAAGVKRIFLLIDQVEDFASSAVLRRRREMEVERFRDLAIETQPFGEMASYVLTMHPAAARAIEEFWSLARLPKIDHLSRQNERVTVILKAIDKLDESERLLGTYMDRFRVRGVAVERTHPFDKGTLQVLIDRNSGRPGHMLKMAHDLIEEGARRQWKVIGSKETIDFVGRSFEEIEASLMTRRRRGIGSIDS
jgi:hypothetical protein